MITTMANDLDILEMAFQKIVSEAKRRNDILFNINPYKKNSMETLKLDKAEAKKQFKSAPEWFRKVLISTFGAGTFSGKAIDQCETYEDFYNEADEATKKEFMIYSTDQPYIVAEKKLMLIIRVVNFDEINCIEFIPDLRNTDQKKWFPIFHCPSGSGFDFSYSSYGYSLTIAAAGLRLCFARKEDCDRIAKKFIDLYEQYLTFKN